MASAFKAPGEAAGDTPLREEAHLSAATCPRSHFHVDGESEPTTGHPRSVTPASLGFSGHQEGTYHEGPQVPEDEEAVLGSRNGDVQPLQARQEPRRSENSYFFLQGTRHSRGRDTRSLEVFVGSDL